MMFSEVAAAPTPQKQGTGAPSSPHPRQNMLGFRLFAKRCSDGCEAVSHRGFEVSSRISLMIREAEHLFTRLSAARMSSLKKCLFSFSAPF